MDAQAMAAQMMADLGMNRREDLELFDLRDPRSSYRQTDIEDARSREEQRRSEVTAETRAWYNTDNFEADRRFKSQESCADGQLHRAALKLSLQAEKGGRAWSQDHRYDRPFHAAGRRPHHHAVQPPNPAYAGGGPSSRNYSPSRHGTTTFYKGRRVDHQGDRAHRPFESFLTPGSEEKESAKANGPAVLKKSPTPSGMSLRNKAPPSASSTTSSLSTRRVRTRYPPTGRAPTSAQQARPKLVIDKEAEAKIHSERQALAEFLIDLAGDMDCPAAKEYMSKHPDHEGYLMLAASAIKRVTTQLAIMNEIYYRDGSMMEKYLYKAAKEGHLIKKADSVIDVPNSTSLTATVNGSSIEHTSKTDTMSDVVDQLAHLRIVDADDGFDPTEEDVEWWLAMAGYK